MDLNEAGATEVFSPSRQRPSRHLGVPAFRSPTKRIDEAGVCPGPDGSNLGSEQAATPATDADAMAQPGRVVNRPLRRPAVAERGVLGVTGLGYLVTDSSGRIAAADPEVGRILGTGHRPLVGELLGRIVHRTVGGRLHAAWRQALVDGTPNRVQICFGGSDGAVYDVHAVPEADGIALYFLAATTAAELGVNTSSPPGNTRYDGNRRTEWPQRRAAQQSEAIHLAMRHAPALQSAAVGGDWCDVFVQAEGHTLVIGDVAGHDATAARAMIRLRCLLRRVAAAATPGAGPAELLTAVDKAMTTQGGGVLTTGIVAMLDRPAGAHAWRLRWSNAGHPPPVVVHADGLISTLETPPDRPLGIGADRSRSETNVVLQPGTTLLLFTDGLVERRGQVIDDGIRSLSTTLTHLGPSALRDPETLCDELFTRLLPGWPEDDVGLLVVHLTTPTALPEAAIHIVLDA